MEKQNFDYADLFWGCEEADLPKPEGLAVKWYKLKALTGNNHPGPCLPYGMVSAVPYSGAYPTGYGVNMPNSYGHPPRYLEENRCKGFTHFQVSGTGGILKYYNFFRVVPLGKSGINGVDTLYLHRNEHAVPGYYETTLGDSGIHAELTAGQKFILHRYTFSKSQPCVAIDLLQCGIAMKDHDQNTILEASISRRSSGCYDAYILCDIPIYACIHIADPAVTGSILLDEQAAGDSAVLANPYGHSLYLLLHGADSSSIELKIAFSLRSADRAYQNLLQESLSFEETAAKAAETWKKTLHAIEINTTDEKLHEIFASSLYFSCIKPANFENESPFYTLRKDCYLDFATLWDQYKTQLPLVFTLYPETASGMVNALLNLCEYHGEFVNTILMSSASSLESQQALSLAVYAIADAYWRNIPGIDWNRALRLIDMDLTRKQYRLDPGCRITYYLDYGEACLSAAAMAEDMGCTEIAQKFRGLARYEEKAYDPVTGLLNQSDFYEGHIKTYSFRLMHDMQKRINMYPDRQKLLDDLDAFFGFTSVPAPQNFDDLSPDENNWRTNHFLRFEGLNNEPDMETPYFYLYLKQHNKTARILHDIFRCMFTTGRGGLPGNNDSGGLSSWYVWNTVGLFPVAGQNLILIGTPAVPDAVLHLSGGKNLHVIAENFSPESFYICGVLWNGTPIHRKWLTVREMMQGGTLVLQMSFEPKNEENFELPGKN